MKADFNPLIGRATFLPSPDSLPAFKISRIPVFSSILQKTHGFIDDSSYSIASHHFSREQFPLSSLKAAKLEHQYFQQFLKEEKQTNKVAKTWANLREGFQDFIRSIKNK